MIEAYFGLPGSGKTYSMMLRLYHYCKINRKGRIYLNMDIDEVHLRKITKFQGEIIYIDEWQDIVRADNGLLILDELNLFMPSRVWAKVPGALLSKWAQVRKSGLEIWYTAQSPKRVDKVVRELTFISHHMTSFKMLGFFTAKVYAGINDKFYCWNFNRFKMKVARMYDTKAFIVIPDIYKSSLELQDTKEKKGFEKQMKKESSFIPVSAKPSQVGKGKIFDWVDLDLPGDDEDIGDESSNQLNEFDLMMNEYEDNFIYEGRGKGSKKKHKRRNKKEDYFHIGGKKYG